MLIQKCFQVALRIKDCDANFKSRSACSVVICMPFTSLGSTRQLGDHNIKGGNPWKLQMFMEPECRRLIR